MNAEERKAYKALRDVPHKKIEAAGREALRSAIELRFKREAEARAARRARLEPAFKAMRTAMVASPEFAALRAPISKVASVPPRRYKHYRPFAHRLKSPIVRLGSIYVVDVPPFQALTGSNPNGIVDTPELTANTNGNMGFTILAGESNLAGPDVGGQTGQGTNNVWAAIGQAYTWPKPSETALLESHNLTFGASPSVTWNAIWASTWWRQAAGNIWVGQIVNQFSVNGSFVGTPVSTQQVLESFDDYNLCDSGDKQGASSGIPLSCSLGIDVVNGGLYECWVVIGGSVTADYTNSTAQVWLQATVNSLVLDIGP